MKKMFVALCGMLPGGFLLLATMLAFTACARLQYQDPAGNVKIRGFTLNPEAAMVMSAEAETIRAQAYAVRSCSEDPKHCGAVWGPWGAGAGMMDTPAGYTWAGIQAGGATNQASGDIRKDIADIKKGVNVVKSGQKALFQTLRNRKGKR